MPLRFLQGGPRGELDYAEITASDSSSTNQSLGGEIVTGLEIDFVSRGRPVLVEFFCANAQNSGADNGSTVLLKDEGGNVILVAWVHSPFASRGQALTAKVRVNVAAGTVKTITAYNGFIQGGTSVFVASALYPCFLRAVET